MVVICEFIGLRLFVSFSSSFSYLIDRVCGREAYRCATFSMVILCTMDVRGTPMLRILRNGARIVASSLHHKTQHRVR